VRYEPAQLGEQLLLLLLLLKSVEFEDDVALLPSVAGRHATACDFEVRNRRHRLCCTEDIVDLSVATGLFVRVYVQLKFTRDGRIRRASS